MIDDEIYDVDSQSKTASRYLHEHGLFTESRLIDALLREKEKLLDQLEAAQKDVEMMDWLSTRLVCADFDYQDSGESVVVFEWPDDAPISADVRSSISSAMQSTN